jgi:peptidoglycan hydrolase CwlO-like protein
MPIDTSDDIADNDPTDELPVLVETVVLSASEAIVDGDQLGDTAERTAKFIALSGGSTAEIESLQNDLAARGAKIAALERDVGRLSARWNEVERHLTARETHIEDLNRTLGDLRHTLADRQNEQQRLSLEIRQRTTEVERLLAENEALRAVADTAQANLAALSEQRTEPPVSLNARAEVELLQEIASLRAYVTNRNDWWLQLKAQAAAAAERIGALERELHDATTARRTATALAERESTRARELRAELVAATRLLEDQRRQRTAGLEPRREPTHSPPPGVSEPAPAPPGAAPSLASIDQRLASAPHAPAAAAAEVLPAPAFEVLAALEAEVAHKRQQISAQLVELRDREQQIEAASGTIARLQKDVASFRAELEQKRTDVGRLERALIDKDRALEARDARIATLHEELNQRLGAIQKLNAMDVSLQGLSSKMSDRLRRAEPAAEPPAAPTLVCLTGDAPKQTALTKKTITIGRGHHCDVRIVTHFVSREHARIVTDGGNVVLEDLGSTNGVFVNSVRVERQELRHGDLVTVGETQFRFLESVAH